MSLKSLENRYRLKRRAFLKYGLVAAGAVVSGCSQTTSPRRQQIKMGVTSRPRMLDPRLATDALSSRVNRLIYHQLIDFNEAFEPVADLATWQQLSATEYIFTLTSFPVFHHGQPLTADDVAATYRSILDPDLGSPHRGSLKNIRAINVLDDRTVSFELYETDALFVGRLVIGILPKDLIEQGHMFQQQPVGSGPCVFKHQSEQLLVLERPDGVQLHFLPVKDATVRVLKLRNAELDLIQNDLSPELAAYCDQLPELKVIWHHGTSFGYIGFNFEDPLLSQLEMRQALAYGIDRKAILQAMFRGQGRLAGGLLVPEHWAGDASLMGWPYRPEKAKTLLETLKQTLKNQPGLVNADGTISLSYKTSSDPTRIRLATIYQSQLKRIGIDLKIQSYDWGTFYNDIKQGRFQLYSLAWVGVKSPDIFQYVFALDAIPPKGANRGRYRSPQADQLIRAAAQADSMTEQAQLYRQLQRHLQQDLAVVPLWYENQYAVTTLKLTQYTMYADGRFDGLLTAQKHS